MVLLRYDFSNCNKENDLSAIAEVTGKVKYNFESLNNFTQHPLKGFTSAIVLTFVTFKIPMLDVLMASLSRSS